jgi:dTDP-4-amino-4,6-dideoxygalactose transaminase
MIAAEGGLVATNRDDVADSIRIGRDYGNPGDYDTRFVGLNARLSELHAAVALESLSELDEHLETRTKLARRYDDALADIPGVAPQTVADGDRSTYKDFTIVVDPDVFGVTRDQLVTVLRAEGVDTRNYFDPPVHRQTAYADLEPVSLPVTDRVASRVVSIPLFRSLPESVVDRIGELFAAVHAHHAAVAAALPA